MKVSMGTNTGKSSILYTWRIFPQAMFDYQRLSNKKMPFLRREVWPIPDRGPLVPAEEQNWWGIAPKVLWPLQVSEFPMFPMGPFTVPITKNSWLMDVSSPIFGRDPSQWLDPVDSVTPNGIAMTPRLRDSAFTARTISCNRSSVPFSSMATKERTPVGSLRAKRGTRTSWQMLGWDGFGWSWFLFGVFAHVCTVPICFVHYFWLFPHERCLQRSFLRTVKKLDSVDVSLRWSCGLLSRQARHRTQTALELK
jgi:hypothetical protein